MIRTGAGATSRSFPRRVGTFQVYALCLVNTTTLDTSKATLLLNVSCHLINILPALSQSRLLDSMHPCLNVDEILRRIACELVESGGKGTAVALACCCKSFEDPVLDALWVEQGQLLPLLKSFPRDVWNEGGCSVSVPIRVF